jgi:hypothetical protein
VPSTPPPSLGEEETEILLAASDAFFLDFTTQSMQTCMTRKIRSRDCAQGFSTMIHRIAFSLCVLLAVFINASRAAPILIDDFQDSQTERVTGPPATSGSNGPVTLGSGGSADSAFQRTLGISNLTVFGGGVNALTYEASSDANGLNLAYTFAVANVGSSTNTISYHASTAQNFNASGKIIDVHGVTLTSPDHATSSVTIGVTINGINANFVNGASSGTGLATITTAGATDTYFAFPTTGMNSVDFSAVTDIQVTISGLLDNGTLNGGAVGSGANANNIQIVSISATIPEPAPIALTSVVAVGFFGHWWRRKKSPIVAQ